MGVVSPLCEEFYRKTSNKRRVPDKCRVSNKHLVSSKRLALAEIQSCYSTSYTLHYVISTQTFGADRQFLVFLGVPSRCTR